MNIFHHPACNDVLRAAPGTEDRVSDLPIMRGEESVSSFWKPTPEELAALNANGCMMFEVWGRTHPPIAVAVVEGNRVVEG